MSDIVERAEAALQQVTHDGTPCWRERPRELIIELVAELKAARAECERIKALLEGQTLPSPTAWNGEEPWPRDGRSRCVEMTDVTERIRSGLFTLLKDIIDGEWGPYDDDHYWPMVDAAMISVGVNELIREVEMWRSVEQMYRRIGGSDE